MRKMAFSTAAVLVAAFLLATPAFAHKIKVFAYAEDGVARGSVYFPGGGKGKDLVVRVTNAAGKKVGEVTTDAEGQFSFNLPDSGTFTFVAETPDGHRGECTVASRSGSSAALTIASEPDAASASEAEVPAIKLGTQIPNDSEDLSHTVSIVSEQLRSLRENINQLEDKRRFSDIIGGIGYILGIAGIAFFFLGAKKRNS